MISLVRYCLEKLCRLPSHKFVSLCKCVSKRWCTLISDPKFIGHFLWIHLLHSLVDSSGDELLTTKVFERLGNFLSSKRSSEAVATCNDLVLCSEKKGGRLDFFICNPRTMEIVTLPPTPGCHERKPLGFICEPYFENDIAQHKDSNLKLVKVNAAYRGKVVRLFTSFHRYAGLPEDRFGSKLQVFSSDTGEWRELVASCPRTERRSKLLSYTGFVSNGVLYWLTSTRLMWLDLFMINNSISTNSENTVDHYQLHVIDFDPTVIEVISRYRRFHLFAVYKGCVHIHFNQHYPFDDRTFFVLELKEQELRQTAVDSTRKLGFENMKSYSLFRNMIPDSADFVEFISFDWDDLHIAYLRGNEEIIKYTIDTARWSKMDVKAFAGKLFQFALPWWPAPVPRLPHAASNEMH